MIHDALVIGGGPGGATTAILLARAGWNVVLAEKSVFPRPKVCGEFISATSLPLLRELGVDEEYLAAAGPPVRRIGIFAGEAALTAAMPQPDDQPEQCGHALGREHLDLMLLRMASRAGAEIRQPCKVTAIQRDGPNFLCTMEEKKTTESVATRLVIAANGSWQPAPYPMPVPPHRDSDLLAFKAHFSDSDLAGDLMPLIAFPGGYGGMVHSDSGAVSLSCCIRRDTLEDCRLRHPSHQAAKAVLHHIEGSCLGVRSALRRAAVEGVWLAAGPIRPGIRPCYADGIFRVGNAAGEAHPIVAEGISMALQSAWLLCRHLVAGQPVAETAKRYEAEWKTSFARRIHVAALFAHLAMRPASTALLPVLRVFPRIVTFGAQLAGKSKLVTAPAR